MQHSCATLREVRQTAGPFLLVVFLLATQVAPLAHLVTHRADHTHGPAAGAAAHHADHEAAHRAGRPHVHRPAPNAPAPPELRGVPAGAPHVSRADTDHRDGATRPDERPAHDHGRNSSTHFGLALMGGPPPPMLPPPAEAVERLPDLRPHRRAAPSPPQPPARGPPDVVGLSLASS